MTDLDKLAKVIAERKRGSFGIIAAIVENGAKLTKEDRKFIATMGTCADELLAVVKAADRLHGGDIERGCNCLVCEIAQAIDALKAKLATLP